MAKFDKNYPKASEKFVKTVTLYADSNKKLWLNSTKTVKAECADVENFFKKNMVLITDGTSFYLPTKMTVSSGTASLIVVDNSGASGAAAVVTFTSQTVA